MWIRGSFNGNPTRQRVSEGRENAGVRNDPSLTQRVTMHVENSKSNTIYLTTTLFRN